MRLTPGWELQNKMETLHNETTPLLEIIGLKTHFFTEDGVVKAVDGIDLEVFPGEVLGLVGESGCGKSQTSFSIMRLIDPPGRVVDGEILFNGNNLLSLPREDLYHIRGNKISMIFQQPQTSLNPVFPVGDQIVEVFQIHQKMDKKTAWQKTIELLRKVGIPDPEKKAKAYPHEMSGGQAQRIMIAMALALDTELLIADEPTTALDVTIQAQILDLLRTIQRERNTAIILITHDLGVIAEMAERVAVMYAGKIVELCDVNELFDHPLHPYTIGLISSVPLMGEIRDRLSTIPGNVPNLINLAAGCRFKDRCATRVKLGLKRCEVEEPELEEHTNGHKVRCWVYSDDSRQVEGGNEPV